MPKIDGLDLPDTSVTVDGLELPNPDNMVAVDGLNLPVAGKKNPPISFGESLKRTGGSLLGSFGPLIAAIGSQGRMPIGVASEMLQPTVEKLRPELPDSPLRGGLPDVFPSGTPADIMRNVLNYLYPHPIQTAGEIGSPLEALTRSPELLTEPLLDLLPFERGVKAFGTITERTAAKAAERKAAQELAERFTREAAERQAARVARQSELLDIAQQTIAPPVAPPTRHQEIWDAAQRSLKPRHEFTAEDLLAERTMGRRDDELLIESRARGEIEKVADQPRLKGELLVETRTGQPKIWGDSEINRLAESRGVIFQGRNETAKKVGGKIVKGEVYEFIDPATKNEQGIPGNFTVKNMSEFEDDLVKHRAKFGLDPSGLKAEDVLSPTNPIPSPEAIRFFDEFQTKASTLFNRTLEFLQDSQRRIMLLYRNSNLKVNPKELNRYELEELFHGRVATRVEESKQMAQEILQDVLASAPKAGATPDEMRTLVNRYLHARHAPERNLALGQERGAGISTAEAKQWIADIESNPARAIEVKRLANRITTLHEETLNILRESGVISDEFVATLRTKYKNHVPLNRVLEQEQDIESVLSGRRFDVIGTGVKRAKGSGRQVSDILDNILFNREQAIIRAERNALDNAFLKTVRENKDLFDGFITERKPVVIGSSGDRPIMQFSDDPRVLHLRENGKAVELFINDVHLATALRGVNPQNLNPFLRTVGAVTRWYSSLATRFNPEFAIPNKIRDIQEAAVYLAAQPELGFKEVAKTSVKDPASMRDILDYMRGKNTTGTQLYKQMKADGGTTGGLALSTRKQIEIDTDKIWREMQSNPRQATQKVLKLVDNWNILFEDATRLSVYKEAIAKGLGRERAALLAKRATINFNKMGTGGPVINSLWMFSNVSVQGSAKMLRAMRNPKVATAVVSSVGGAVFAVSAWNDSVDPDWRTKMSKTDRFNGLPILLPTDEGMRYILIPASWGIKPIMVAMSYASDAVAGKSEGVADVASGMVAAVVEAYNPLGGTDAISAVTPTILDTPVDIARNRSWTGNPIRPDWDKFAPRSTQYFESLRRNLSGRVAIRGTKALADFGIEISPADAVYVYNQVIGGAGQFVNRVGNVVASAAQLEAPELRETPFIRRFLRSRTEEEVERRTSVAEAIKKELGEQSRSRFYTKEQAQELFQQIDTLSYSDQLAEYRKIRLKAPELAEKIRDLIDEKRLGLTSDEKLMKQLGVENGERAGFILNYLSKFPDENKRNTYYRELIRKGILTDEVRSQYHRLRRERLK